MKRKIPENISSALTEFTRGVQEIFGNRAKKVILYGSYARGDFNKHSDIDLIVLTDIPNEEMGEYKNKIWDYAYDIDLNYDIILSVLVKNIDSFNKWLDFSSFYINVQKDGVVLNES